MINIDYEYNFSPEFKQSLDNLRITANSFAKSLEPYKEQQEVIQETLSKTNLYTTVGQISKSIAPLIEMSNEYNEMVRTVTNSIPTINPDISRQIAEIGSVMSLAISSGYFENEITSEQEMSDLLNKKIQDSVGTEVVSKIHEEYQQAPDNESENSNPTDKQNNIAKHNDLRSDLTSKEWHLRMIVESVYTSFIIPAVFLYLTGIISDIDLNQILRTIGDFLSQLQ